jgi:hypothetical protein
LTSGLLSATDAENSSLVLAAGGERRNDSLTAFCRTSLMVIRNPLQLGSSKLFFLTTVTGTEVHVNLTKEIVKIFSLKPEEGEEGKEI